MLNVGAVDGLDSPDVVIIYGCQVLDDAGVKFKLGGFGLADWNLDVRYDLSVFLEQISQVIQCITAGENSEIVLYSQGLERTLEFHAAVTQVRVHCVSGTSWTADPADEYLESRKLVNMFKRLMVDFAGEVARFVPSFVAYEPIRAWLQAEGEPGELQKLKGWTGLGSRERGFGRGW